MICWLELEAYMKNCYVQSKMNTENNANLTTQEIPLITTIYNYPGNSQYFLMQPGRKKARV